MARNISMLLGDHFEKFIDEQVASGSYASSSDVVRDALRLLERVKKKEEVLLRALDEGSASGPAEDFSMERFIAELDELPEQHL
jgi:antitoxin ParD1/3/4